MAEVGVVDLEEPDCTKEAGGENSPYTEDLMAFVEST